MAWSDPRNELSPDPSSMRLDQLLVHRGLFASRERARRAVLSGAVTVAGRKMLRPAAAVEAGVDLAVGDAGEPFVSRGGRKLAAALDHFGLDPCGWTCLDAGASTGGFTDCLLQRGAGRVFAVDVGHGQLAEGLRRDPRVLSWEGVNARELAPDLLPGRCRLVVADLSFISVLKVAPALLPHLLPGGWFLPLIKPQFEAGPGAVGKGGILRDRARREAVLRDCYGRLAALALEPLGLFDCPLSGAGGNREAFACLRRREVP